MPRRSAILFCALALYDGWSTPALAERWSLSPAGVAFLILWAAAAAFAVTTALRDTGHVGWTAFALVAIGLRLASLALVEGRTSPSDPRWYLELASHLLAEQGLFVDDPANERARQCRVSPLSVAARWLGRDRGSVVAVSSGAVDAA